MRDRTGNIPSDATAVPRRRRRAHVAAVAVAALGLLGTACGASSTAASGDAAPTTAAAASGGTAPGREAAAIALEQGATVIDVRTPEEHDAGHVEGARLIDIQGSGFDAEIATLDPSVTYVVYCRSGNRSAVAAQRMTEAGLTVLDGGGLDDMQAAGWPVTG